MFVNVSIETEAPAKFPETVNCSVSESVNPLTLTMIRPITNKNRNPWVVISINQYHIQCSSFLYIHIVCLIRRMCISTLFDLCSGLPGQLNVRTASHPTYWPIYSVARGFGPFRIWPPEVSAKRFRPFSSSAPSYENVSFCQYFFSFLCNIVIPIIFAFKSQIWSKSRSLYTAIIKGRQPLH